MEKQDKQFYLDAVSRQLSRVLSSQDRESHSKTRGCFDRNFWCSRYSDYPRASAQETVYALAGYAMNAPSDDQYLPTEALVEWAKEGLSFWTSIQRPDGSFYEAYPYDRRFVATASSSFYSGEAFLLIANRFSATEANAIRICFASAGDWLCKNDESWRCTISTHLAMAAASLDTIYHISHDKRHADRRDFFLREIYDHQSPEGWYREYGGADPGSQTYSTFLLARIWERGQCSKLLRSLRKSVAWLTYFIHPNRTIGGEYGSTVSDIYFPAGFELLREVSKEAQAISDFMRPAINSSPGLGTLDFDDCIPLMNNFVFAAAASGQPAKESCRLPFQTQTSKTFFHAGICVKSTAHYYAIVGLRKGGVLKVYETTTGKLIGSECGYWAKLKGSGEIVSTLNLVNRIYGSATEDRIHVDCGFAKVIRNVPSPWHFIVLRLSMCTLGRIPKLASLINWFFFQRPPHLGKFVPISLKREILFKNDRVEVTDLIEAKPGMELLLLCTAKKFTSHNTDGRSHFFSEDLAMMPFDEEIANNIDPSVVSIRRSITITT